MSQRVQRSWLVVPANDKALLAQAEISGADVVVLDLEDTVHETRKHEAREHVHDAITQMRDSGAEVYVRPDIELLYADLKASVWRGLSGVLLPRVTSVEQVQEADQILAEFEVARGVVKPPPVGEVSEADDPRGPEQALEIHLCLDTGRGNWDAAQLIAASPRIQSVSLGRADLVMDLREEPSGDLHLMPYLNQRLVIIANAAGVRPIGAWWRATSRGLAASHEETLKAAITGQQAGFKGALCMRAHQVDALNSGFTPSSEEIAWAEAVTLNGEKSNAAQPVIAASMLEWAAACKSRDQAKALMAASA